MREKLVEIFPEFNLIKNTSLREKTLAVWEEAITRGGWKVEDLTRIPFTLLIPDCKVNIIDHTRSVTQVAIESARIAERFNGGAYKIDYDMLIAGGLLHDVGKIVEYENSPETIR